MLRTCRTSSALWYSLALSALIALVSGLIPLSGRSGPNPTLPSTNNPSAQPSFTSARPRAIDVFRDLSFGFEENREQVEMQFAWEQSQSIARCPQ
jgi:hypothetical protein